MSKKIISDINIKRHPREGRMRPAPVVEEYVREEEPVYERKVYRDRTPERAEHQGGGGKKVHKTKYLFWVVAVVSVIFFLFALSYLFSRVTVTIDPKNEVMSLNENFSAQKDVNSAILPFDLIVVEGEEKKTVRTTEKRDISKKAEGVIVIYNSFGPSPQLLSIDTRLEGSNGKIYKTKKQVYVPGMKGTTPGSIEVAIYGAEAGEEYNSTPLDFKVLGFKGTPKYTKFYARSKGSIVGGFEGKGAYVSPEQKVKIIEDLKAVLEASLFKKAANQIPKGFVLFKDAVFLDTASEEVSPSSGDSDTFPVKVSGTLYGLLFNEEKLTKGIVGKKMNGYDGSPVYISNIKDLVFSISNKDNELLSEVKNIDFNLSGKAKIVWKVDEKKLIGSLLGKAKKDFKQILLQYPSIDSADLVISPFWKRTLPDRSKDIEVKVNYPK